MFEPIRVKLLEADGVEKTWTVKTKKLRRGTLGVCDYDEREIHIHPQPDTIAMLGVLVHELVHQSLPDLSEEAALRVERNWLAVFAPLVEQWEVL